MGSQQSSGKNTNISTEPTTEVLSVVAPVTIPAKTYQTVKIQDLPEITGSGFYSCDARNNLLRMKCRCEFGTLCKCVVKAYYENNPAKINGGFYRAFAYAYNNHKGLILSPDDVWMRICLYFTECVNNNPEKFRDLFVSHKEKKKLTVTTRNELSESQWDEFFELILPQIKANTKDNVTDLLMCNFSTSEYVEKLLSTATIMDTFKKYFEYERCIPRCGITNVKFLGTLKDWELLIVKTENLRKYHMEKYVDDLLPILHKFVDSYNGNVDVDFWNHVMNRRHGRIGSGSTTFISGWILKFYGLTGEVEDSDFADKFIDVPVEIKNYMTGKKTIVSIVGGFNGIYEENGAYRPAMSMLIHENPADRKSL